MIFSLYRFLFVRVFFLMFLFSLCRLLFYLFYSDHFEGCDSIQILNAFLLGLRFDISILLSANILFFLFLSIGKFFQIRNSLFISAKVLFIFMNAFLLALNLIDLEYFAYTGKRTGIEILGIRNDVLNQSSQLLMNYWHLMLLWIVLLYFLSRNTFKIAYTTTTSKRPVLYFAIAYAIFIGLSIVGIRGGFQLKPLRPNVAFTIEPNKLGHVALNTPFNIFMTYGIPPLQEASFLNDPAQVRTILNSWNHQKPLIPFKNTAKSNVVIIILESFAHEYMGLDNPYAGYTPFLDSLAKKNLYFANHYANGRRSMEAVPSILASMPGLMEEPYITSLYQTNSLYGLGNILQPNGYHTSFFHAARNGSMGFDAFTQNAGFTHYYGLSEYPDMEKDFDGNWGIYDEPYLQYFNKTISTFPQPFISCVFTLSSHQPYSIPEALKNRFVKGDLDIHQSIGYVDYALKRFFEAAQKEAWYSNTLFVITADHTQMNSRKEYNNVHGRFNVPLVFFHPGMKLNADTSLIAQHTDIMPSILDYLNIENPNASLLGQSVFGKEHGYAVTFSDNSYRVFLPGYYVEGNLQQPFTIKNNLDQQIRKASDQEAEFLKAIIEYHNNGLIHNSFYTYGKGH